MVSGILGLAFKNVLVLLEKFGHSSLYSVLVTLRSNHKWCVDTWLISYELYEYCVSNQFYLKF